MEKDRKQHAKTSRTLQPKSAAPGSVNIVDNRHLSLSGSSLQRVEDEEEEVAQGKMEHAVQRVEGEEDDEVLQGKMGDAAPKNETGLPDNLKAGVESLSGFSLDNVRVHYNSSKPATVQALAYTQGTDIHVAPGQEKHLPHEAWHVAQQMAGRVAPTTSVNGMPVNDNAALEHEADVMGAKAVQCKSSARQKPYAAKSEASKGVSQLIRVTEIATTGERILLGNIKTYDELCKILLDKRSHSKFIIGDDPAIYSRTDLKKALVNAAGTFGVQINTETLGINSFGSVSISGAYTLHDIAAALKRYSAGLPPTTTAAPPWPVNVEFAGACSDLGISPGDVSLHKVRGGADSKDASKMKIVGGEKEVRIDGLMHESHGSRSLDLTFTTAFYTKEHLFALGKHKDSLGFNEPTYKIVWVNQNIGGNPFKLKELYCFE